MTIDNKGETSARKDEHIQINLHQDVDSDVKSGFTNLYFLNESLPEINLQQIETKSRFLGNEFRIPLLISSMTGGTEGSERINIHLGEAAEFTGIGMAVGSQRTAINGGKKTGFESIREYAPTIPVYSNIGAIQLNNGFQIGECLEAVEMIQANSLILHLNPLQEALQPEGQTNFKGLLSKIKEICKMVGVPVIVKEVGWGISAETAKRLIDVGVSAIDVAGAGGTSWSQVEMFRNKVPSRIRISSHFKDWGISTADAVRMVHENLPTTPVIASGGIRTGMDIAKSIALGASLGGVAGPILKAADNSTKDVIDFIQELELELRITMFACGAGDLAQLAKTQIYNRSNGTK